MKKNFKNTYISAIVHKTNKHWQTIRVFVFAQTCFSTVSVSFHSVKKGAANLLRIKRAIYFFSECMCECVRAFLESVCGECIWLLSDLVVSRKCIFILSLTLFLLQQMFFSCCCIKRFFSVQIVVTQCSSLHR